MATPRIFCCETSQPLKYDVCGQLLSSGGFLHHRRSFEFHVFIAVTEGTLFVTSGGVPYEVSAGQYILLRAGEEHFGHKPSEGRLSYMWVHFSAELKITSGNESCPYIFPEYGGISPSGRGALLFRQLAELSLEEQAGSEYMRDYALSLLLLEISREYRSAENSGTEKLPAVILSVTEWIKSNYFRQFTVAELADKFGYQADYLSSLFKKSTGVSLVRYTNMLRVKSAKNLLLGYGLSVKETAFSCGFSDEKYFMRIFKEYEGVTPTEYKNSFAEK